MPRSDAPGRRRELVRVFRVDAAFDGVTFDRNVALLDRHAFARRNANLDLHDIDAGNHLSHRMLDLEARIHLDEIKLILLVEELERAGAFITDLAARFGATFADADAAACRQVRRGCFFDNLLMAALHRAIAIANVNRISKFIREHLNFNVARILEKLLHVNRRVAESRRSLGLGQ